MILSQYQLVFIQVISVFHFQQYNKILNRF